MQTVSLVDLRERPGETLLVLHIQPPLLDALRASLARLWPAVGKRALVVRVDRGLYLVWTIVYASMGVLVFRWLRPLLSSTWIAGLAALAFFFHPAAIHYATFLEGTLLTSFGILWLCYALWRIPARGATLSLAAAYVLLFFVRSIFQWPALVVLVAALLLRQAPRRSVLVVALSCGAVVGSFMLKQYLVLGTTSTSSFAGMSCLQALGEEPEIGLTSPTDTPLGPLFPRLFPGGAPAALTRETKIGGAHNFNHLADLRNGRALAAALPGAPDVGPVPEDARRLGRERLDLLPAVEPLPDSPRDRRPAALARAVRLGLLGPSPRPPPRRGHPRLGPPPAPAPRSSAASAWRFRCSSSRPSP